jgi:hypothetical protein
LAEDIGGERVPDPDTPAAQFLMQQADEGTAFVRRGRTPELEAIFPPGSEFRRVGTAAVDLPDATVGEMDIFQRVRQEADDTDVDMDRPRGSGETFTTEELAQRQTTRGTGQGRTDVPEGTPIIPSGGVFTSPTTTGGATVTDLSTGSPTTARAGGGSGTGAGTGTGTSGSGGGGPTTSVGRPTPTDVSEVFGVPSTTGFTAPTLTGSGGGPSGTGSGPSGGPSGPTDPTTPPSGGPSGSSSIFGPPSSPPSSPPSGPPSSPPSGPPSEPPSSPPSAPPSSPPSGPPSSPPSSPPSGPPGGPPSAPPSSPPFLPPFGPPSGPPTRPPERDRDTDDDENPLFGRLPEGQEFGNPLVSGAGFLGVGGGQSGQNGGQPLDGAGGLFGGGASGGASGGVFGFGQGDDDLGPFGGMF